MQIDSYTPATYRVSVKAIIKNEKGEVLLVKEGSNDWDFPGGGIDHGEDPETAMRRELWEEVKITDLTLMVIKNVFTFDVTESERYGMWIVYDVTTSSGRFECGEDVTEAAFIDPETLRNDDIRSHKFILKALQ